MQFFFCVCFLRSKQVGIRPDRYCTQPNNAFEAMAAVADTSPANPARMREVISNQLAPMPRLLGEFVSASSTARPSSGAGAGGVGGVAGDSHALSMKRSVEDASVDNQDGSGPPPSKKARDQARSPLPSSTNAGGTPGSGSQDASTADTSGAGAASSNAMGAENGGGVSLPSAVSAPQTANLMMVPATTTFRQGGPERLMKLLKEKVGRLFTLEAQCTRVRSIPQSGNGTSSADGSPSVDVDKGVAQSGLMDTTPQPGGGDPALGAGTKKGFRQVLARLKALRAGHFVVYIAFDITSNEQRPRDVSVLAWAEAGENDVSGANSPRGFKQVMDGTAPLRQSQHNTYIRVSSHAYQVGWSLFWLTPPECVVSYTGFDLDASFL